MQTYAAKPCALQLIRSSVWLRSDNCITKRSSGSQLRTHRVYVSAVGQENTDATARRLELSTEDVQSGIEFSKIPSGRGMAVVIQKVHPGPLSDAGLAAGQQLVGISDPIQADQVWPLRENASLRYVRDAIRMRRAETVTLLVSSSSILQEVAAAGATSTGENAAAANAPACGQPRPQEEGTRAGGRGQQAGLGEGGDSSDNEQDFLDVLVASFDEGDSMQRGAGESSMDGTSTLASRVEQLSAEKERQMTAYRRRVKKRKEYLNEVSQRNDSKFFLWLAIAFLGPAFIGLALAYTSGYLDLLQTMY